MKFSRFSLPMLFVLMGAGCVAGGGAPSINPAVSLDEEVTAFLGEPGRHEVWLAFEGPVGESETNPAAWQADMQTYREEILACGGVSSRNVVDDYTSLPIIKLDVTATEIALLSWCPRVVGFDVPPQMKLQ